MKPQAIGGWASEVVDAAPETVQVAPGGWASEAIETIPDKNSWGQPSVPEDENGGWGTTDPIKDDK